MAKKRMDKRKLFTKIIAGFLAVIMILSVGFTLIWYLVVNK